MKERVKNGEKKPRAFERYVGFAVRKRKWIYFIAVLMALCCIWTSVMTQSGRSTVSYMPSTTNAGMGSDIVESELKDLAMAQVLLENTSFSQGEYMKSRIEELDGVHSVEYDETRYNDGRAVLKVTFDDEDSELSRSAFKELRNMVKDFDGGIASKLFSGWSLGWGADLGMIILYVASAVLIIIAMVYASRAYRDVFVSFVLVAFAVLLNYGTNFIFGKISNTTMRAAGVIQAALTMYYPIMICRSYTAARKESDVEESIVKAFTGNAKKILASGLIAIAVFGALCIAANRIGLEFGLVLLKGIAISIICVFVLLPGIIMSNSRRIDRSKHKSLLPKVKKRGRFTFSTKKVFPILFLILAIGAVVFTCVYTPDPYAYTEEILPLPVKSGSQWIESRIKNVFGKSPVYLDMLVPEGDFETEDALTEELSHTERVISVRSLTNTEAATYYLGDLITEHQFADITDLDLETSTALFDGYLSRTTTDGEIITTIREIPFADIMNYTYARLTEGSLKLEKEEAAKVTEVYKEVAPGASELRGQTYDRIIIGVNLPYDSNEAAQFVRGINAIGQARYEGEVYLTGANGGIADMQEAYHVDRLTLIVATAVLLICALFFLLRRIGLAIVLSIMITGGACLTLAVPYIFPGYVLFTGAMLAYSVQACALGNYAAMTANSYSKYKEEGTLKKAIGKSLKANYIPVVVTGVLIILTGVIMAALSFDRAVTSFGIMLAIGGIFSLLTALCVVPQTLLFWDIIVAKVTNKKIVLSSMPEPSNDAKMDIVDAIEKLKADEYKAMMEEPTVVIPTDEITVDIPTDEPAVDIPTDENTTYPLFDSDGIPDYGPEGYIPRLIFGEDPDFEPTPAFDPTGDDGSGDIVIPRDEPDMGKEDEQ